MITIKPFKAIFPKKNLGNEISTRQLNSYTEEEIALTKKNRPNSFLNIILPDYHHNIDLKEDRSNRFLKIRELFETALSKDLFDESETNCFYLYRQTSGNNIYT